MHLTRVIGVTCFGLLLLPLVIIRAQEEKPKTKQPQPDKADAKPVSIPKEQIYTTSSEDGFKKQLLALFRSKDDTPVFPYSYDLKVIMQDSHGMGASNIFLVRGDDITQAVAGTRSVFATAESADHPPARDGRGRKVKSEKMWLVVYLGCRQSRPPVWQFESVKFHDQTIEFRYKSPEILGGSGDGIQYFYWVPMPALKKGTYELKLIDAGKGRPMLIRFVDVS